MKDNRLEQRIQHSLNAELSGLNTTSWQRDQFFVYTPIVHIMAIRILILKNAFNVFPPKNGSRQCCRRNQQQHDCQHKAVCKLSFHFCSSCRVFKELITLTGSRIQPGKLCVQRMLNPLFQSVILHKSHLPSAILSGALPLFSACAALLTVTCSAHRLFPAWSAPERNGEE